MKYQTALLHEILNEVREQKRSIKKEENNQGKAYNIEKFYADAPAGDENEKGLKEVVLNIDLSSHEWDKFQRQPFYQELMRYLNNSEERMIFYLCDGKKEDCPRTHCYKTEAGGCRHTSDINHAINFKKRKYQAGLYSERKSVLKKTKWIKQLQYIFRHQDYILKNNNQRKERRKWDLQELKKEKRKKHKKSTSWLPTRRDLKDVLRKLA